MSHHLIAHVEIPVTDIDKAKTFYRGLFGWDLKDFGRGYSLYNSHRGTTIGIRKAESIVSGDTTIFHMLVEDIDASLETVQQLGGKVYREKTIIPVFGYYALFQDPDGNILGLYQAH